MILARFHKGFNRSKMIGKFLFLFLYSQVGSFCCIQVSGQNVHWQRDTVTAMLTTGEQTIHDYIINNDSTAAVISWKVIASNFPADWVGSNFGICDNALCYNNASKHVWNPVAGAGYSFTSAAYAAHSIGEFHLQLILNDSGSTGSYYMSVRMEDTVHHTADTATFVLNRVPSGIATISGKVGEYLLYPNPATDILHVSATASEKLSM